MGGKSSGSNGTTTVSTTQPPASVLAAYNNVVSRAQNVAGQPLQQYQGPIVAGFNPYQQQAMGAIAGNLGTAQPYINSAAQEFGQATQPLWSGVQQFSPGAVSQYESPYTQQVVQATQNQFNNQNAQQQQGLIGNAITSGAWGGDRASVAQGVLAGQQQLAQAPVIAGLENQGYSQALGEFNQQQQSQLGANQANAWLNSQAAFGLGQLGQEAQNTTAAAAQQELGVGGLQQQLAQEQLNVPYEQFLQQQAYPFQTTNWLAGITEGIGGNQGGSSTTTTPGPSTGSELAGLGIAGLGAYGQATSGKGKSTGGRVGRRADGGSISLPGVPDVSISYVPSSGPGSGGGRGMGPPAPPSNAAAAEANAKQSASKSSGVGNMIGKAAGNAGSGKTAGGVNALSGSGIDAAGSDVGGLTSGGFGADAFAASGAGDAAVTGDLGALSDVAAFLNRGGVARRASGGGTGGVTHSNTWLGDIGGIAGSVAGGVYGGPAGSYLGKGVGRDAFQGFGDLFAGNWGGLNADANPVNMLPASKGGGGNARGLFNRGGGVLHRAVGGASNPLMGQYGQNPRLGMQEPIAKSPGAFRGGNDVSIPLLSGNPSNVPPIASNLTGNFSAPNPAGTANPVPAQPVAAAPTGVVPTPGPGAEKGDQSPIARWIGDQGGFGGNKRGGRIAHHADGDAVVPSESDAVPATPEPTPATASGVVPAAAPATGGLDTKTLRESIANPHVDPWMSVIQAGLAIAGGNSPHALQNIAQGAQAGLANYSQQRQAAVAQAEKEFDAEARAKQLNDVASHYLATEGQSKAELAEKVANDRATQAHQTAALEQQGKYQQGELGLRGQELAFQQKQYADNQYNYVPTVQTDPDDPTKTPVPGVLRTPKHGGELPVFIPTNTNPNKPSAAAAAGQGSRAEVYFNRVVSAGNEAAAAAKNIMELPTTSSTGIFGGRSQGPGLMGAAKESLTNTLTSQEVQDYNTMIPGVSRNLAAIEASGLAPAGSLTHSLDTLALKEGDSELTKLRKMAEMRQIVEKGLEPNLSNPRIPPEQKAAVQKIMDSMSQAIPFTHHDITKLLLSGNDQQTLGDLAKAKGLGQTGAAPAAVAPVITDKAGYDALPAGSHYSTADGTIKIKGGQ